jgi:hypothetical protein
MPLRELLSRATQPTTSGGLALTLSAKESYFLERLIFIRDSFDHPKQLNLIITVEEIVDAISGAISIVRTSIEREPWLLYLTEFDLEFVCAVIAHVEEIAQQNWKLAELAGKVRTELDV